MDSYKSKERRCFRRNDKYLQKFYKKRQQRREERWNAKLVDINRNVVPVQNNGVFPYLKCIII
jgi:hypothetical protein